MCNKEYCMLSIKLSYHFICIMCVDHKSCVLNTYMYYKSGSE